MTPTAELINAALARLEHNGTFVEWWREDDLGLQGDYGDIRDELAALIRKAAEPSPLGYLNCRICNGWPDEGGSTLIAHAPDCALIALCKAVVGEKS